MCKVCREITAKIDSVPDVFRKKIREKCMWEENPNINMPAALGVFVRLLRRLIRFQNTQPGESALQTIPQHTSHTRMCFLQKNRVIYSCDFYFSGLIFNPFSNLYDHSSVD